MNLKELRQRMYRFFGEKVDELTDQECSWIEQACKDLFYCSNNRFREFNFIRYSAKSPRIPRNPNARRRLVNLPRGAVVIEF